MASYLYYQRDQSLLTDEYFDKLAVLMRERWRSISHQHKHLIDPGDLEAGTGFAITAYPAIVKSAADRLMRDGA